jgi:hypothetical protein
MHDADRREPAPGNLAHSPPGHTALLATSTESALPVTDDLVVEGFEGAEVQGHPVVVEVSTDDRAKPSTHLRDGVVLPKACSGDRYGTVPTINPSRVRIDDVSATSLGFVGLARPKSRILTRPSGITIRFCGLRSR